MNVRKCFVMLALAATSVCAQAETVELVLNVSTTAQWASRSDGFGNSLPYDGPAFTPQSFEWRVRFDLDTSLVESFRSDERLIAETFFANGQTQATPYSSALLSRVPSGMPVVMEEHTQVAALLSTNRSLPIGPVLPSEAVDVHTIFAGGGEGWRLVSDGVVSTAVHGRSFTFDGAGTPVQNTNFKPMTGQDFVKYLQSQVGQKKVAAFAEVFDLWEQKAYGSGADVWTSGLPEDLISHESIYIQGDVSIASVTSVPEPSSAVLVGMGLMLIAGVQRKRAGSRHGCDAESA